MWIYRGENSNDVGFTVCFLCVLKTEILTKNHFTVFEDLFQTSGSTTLYQSTQSRVNDMIYREHTCFGS